jgi:hypothetical protein
LRSTPGAPIHPSTRRSHRHEYGRLLTLVALAHPQSRAVAIDFSEAMIERLVGIKPL